jgi:hypothetical protein
MANVINDADGGCGADLRGEFAGRICGADLRGGFTGRIYGADLRGEFAGRMRGEFTGRIQFAPKVLPILCGVLWMSHHHI